MNDMQKRVSRVPLDLIGGSAVAAIMAVVVACGGGGGGGTGGGNAPIPPTSTPTPIASSAPIPASASGTVTDDAAQPLSGATVSLAPYQTPPPSGAPEPTMAPAVATTTTDASGAYSFSNVPAGTYLLSVTPQDASAVYSPPPSPYPTPDSAQSGMGATTTTHSTLHEKVALASGSNALGIDQVLRLTDNELLCAQVFESDRAANQLPALPVDTASQGAVRTAVDYLAANGTSDPVNPYAGVGVMQAGDYHLGTTCPGVVVDAFMPPISAPLGSKGFAFVGMSTTNPNAGGPYSGVSLVTYP